MKPNNSPEDGQWIGGEDEDEGGTGEDIEGLGLFNLGGVCVGASRWHGKCYLSFFKFINYILKKHTCHIFIGCGVTMKRFLLSHLMKNEFRE